MAEAPSNFGIKITLKDPDAFLLVKETLTRLGVASNGTKTLYQSAHILYKHGEYYIAHFKELFVLDGRFSSISEEDIQRRNLITKLLSDWNLVTIVDDSFLNNLLPLSGLKVISHKDKDHWQLVPKYTIGNKTNYVNGNK